MVASVVAPAAPLPPVLFAPPDYDLLSPPGYPHTLTIYAHARWRLDPLPEAAALGPRWASTADFRRWLSELPDVTEDPGQGTVGTRGVRTAHLLLRPGQVPAVGWSSYQKIFNKMETPMRLSPLQREAVEQFTVLRSVDLAILAQREMPREDATRVRRLRLLGLPESVAQEPEHHAARKFHGVVRDKLTFNEWDIEVHPAVINRNPAAFLSPCYLAPILGSPTLSVAPHRFPAGPVDKVTGVEENRLLREMGDAVRLRDTARMAELFAGMVSHVQRVGPSVFRDPPGVASRGVVDGAAESPPDAGEASDPTPEGEEEVDPSPRPRRGRGR